MQGVWKANSVSLKIPALSPCASIWPGLNILPCPQRPSMSHHPVARYPEGPCKSSACKGDGSFSRLLGTLQATGVPMPFDPSLSLLAGICYQWGQAKMFSLNHQMYTCQVLLSGAAWIFCITEKHYLRACVAAREQSCNAYFSCKIFFSVCTALWLSECHSV